MRGYLLVMKRSDLLSESGSSRFVHSNEPILFEPDRYYLHRNDACRVQWSNDILGDVWQHCEVIEGYDEICV